MSEPPPAADLNPVSIPPTDIPGTENLYELRLDVEAFDPCIDLMANGAVLATLLYDARRERTYLSGESKNVAGKAEDVEDSEAAFSEREIGWCLQFTDETELVPSISRMPPSWEEHVLAAAWVQLADRIDERGPWDPGPEFRLWGRPDGPDEIEDLAA